mgnify:CR=1 FL=1
MKHFLCRHTFIYMCVMFLCAICIFVLCLIPKVLYSSIMALSWTRVGEAGISRMAYLRKISVIAPLDINFPRPPAHRQTSTFARHRAQAVMSTARERKNARFFLHAATRWHSASYVRFKRNSRKFLQNFFAKNLVCVPKVRTFALAKQK